MRFFVFLFVTEYSIFVNVTLFIYHLHFSLFAAIKLTNCTKKAQIIFLLTKVIIFASLILNKT